MATALDVVRYIKSQMRPYGEVQLQKLTYYSQAWSLVWDGRPLFTDRIEAWRMGPVVPAIRYSADVAANADALTESERSMVDAVIAYYGTMTGAQLGNRTHDEDPWRHAREGLGDRDEGNREISLNSMRSFYSKLALAGLGPGRTPAQPTVAADADVLESARRNAQRWEAALDLLAK